MREGFGVSHAEPAVTQVPMSEVGVHVCMELVNKPGTVMGIISTWPGRNGQESDRHR